MTFKAVLYTQNAEIATTCRQAFEGLPLDYLALDDATAAADYLASERFDIAVIDLGSFAGRALLNVMDRAAFPAGFPIVLAMTGTASDEFMAELRHDLLLCYPVTIADLRQAIERAMPLVIARRSPELSAATRRVMLSDEDIETVVVPQYMEPVRSLKPRRDRLSIVGQEWVASLCSAIASIWYVSEITTNFVGWWAVLPPTGGPTELIALSVLFWLYAKYRRVHETAELCRAVAKG